MYFITMTVVTYIIKMFLILCLCLQNFIVYILIYLSGLRNRKNVVETKVSTFHINKHLFLSNMIIYRNNKLLKISVSHSSDLHE